MNVVVAGATGRGGRRVVAEAVRRGHNVIALVRREGTAPDDTTEVVGDATDQTVLEEALAGADALLMALGGSPGQGYGVVSEGAAAAIKALSATGRRRVVVIGQSGILDAPDGGYRGKNISDEYRPMFEQHLKAYELYRESDLDWTIFCPPNLPDGDGTGNYVVAIEAFPDDPSRQAVTGDVADAMVSALEDEKTFKKRVGIVTRGEND